jgi:hypothetical protein
MEIAASGCRCRETMIRRECGEWIYFSKIILPFGKPVIWGVLA